MKGKWCLLALALICLSLPVMAKDKDKGVETRFDNWGIVTVPPDITMEEGTQPFLTARSYGNDVVRMLEEIYPAEPVCWQIVEKDDASFQYGYMLRYSLDIWQVEAAVEGKQQENAYLRDIGSRPSVQMLASHANNRLRISLPSEFELVQPFTARKVRGTTFYESRLRHVLLINQSYFTESIYVLAWQHGDFVEIAVIFGHNEEDQHLPDTLLSALENAKKMPRS